MDFRNNGGGGGGGNKKRQSGNNNPQKSSSSASSSSRYNVTPPSSSQQQEQMNQLLLQQYFMQEQERGGGGGGGNTGNNMAAAQAAAAAALFGGMLGDKFGGSGGGGGMGSGGGMSSREQQQLSELFAAAAAAQQQQQQQQSSNRSSSNTPSPSPRISSPQQQQQSSSSQQQQQRAQQREQQQTAAATAAALQQLTAASVAAALQQQSSSNSTKKDSNAAQAALAAQQQWMYLDYLQRIQQDVQAQAALASAAQQHAQAQQQQQQQQQQAQQSKGRGRSNSMNKQNNRAKQQHPPPPPPQLQRMGKSPRNSSTDLTRLFEQYAQQQQPNTNSLLKSSVLASAKLPADTEIIVQKNRNAGGGSSSSSAMLQQLQKSLQQPPTTTQQPPQHNKRGPKPKNQQQQQQPLQQPSSTITSEQAKFEQQLINLGNNNAITITPANLDMKQGGGGGSGGSLSTTPAPPITITPATSGSPSSPPPAHSTPFRYGNDRREDKLDESSVAAPAHKYVKELYTHVIPRRPQIGLIGGPSPGGRLGNKPNSKKPGNPQQFRHHRPWIIEPNSSDVIITPATTSTPPPLNLNLKPDNKSLVNSKFLNIPKPAPEPIIISPPDYSIPIKDGWKREMILKQFDLSEENIGLACEVTYISPEGKVFSSLNEIKKSNVGEPKNFTFNSKIQLGRFVLPVSEGSGKRFEFEELVDYFHERKKAEALRKRNLRMRHEHLGYVKLIEAFRKNKRKLKISGGGFVRRVETLDGVVKGYSEVDELIEDVAGVLPRLSAVDGKKLNDKTFANLLQIHEFLHTFGETLGFDSESLPSLGSLQKAFLHVEDNEEELVSVLCHLLVCAVEDPGLPNPTGVKHLTPFGQTLKQADVTFGSMSEILRIYLIGISDSEPEAEEFAGWLEVAPFTAQSAYRKSVVVSFICDLLLQNKAVLRYLENCSELIHNCKKEKQQNEIRVRKLRMLVARKQVAASIDLNVDQEGGGGGGDKVDRSGSGGEESSSGGGLGCKCEIIIGKGGGLVEELVSAGEDSMIVGDDAEQSLNSSSINITPGNNNPGVKSSKDPAYAAVASVADSISSDPDSKLTIEELNSKMASLGSSNEKLKRQMQNNSKCIRSVCLGQDRWRRRYWNLHFGGGVYVEGGATGEFEEVRNAVKEKFEKNPELATMEVDQPVEEEVKQEVVAEEVVVKKEVVAVAVEEGEVIKEEETPAQSNPTPPVEVKRSTPFTVPPPVIKIFSLGPRPPCSGKTVEPEDSVLKLTDDELLVKHVRGAEWFDWKCIRGEEELNGVVGKLFEKGIREKNLKNALSNVGNSGRVGVAQLRDEELDSVNVDRGNDDDGFVDPELLYKIHLGLIETLETLEERVASASLQVKGWVLPSRNLMNENLSEEKIIEIVKERVLDLENAVERRYLKPPLGKSGLEVNLTQLLKESEDVSYNMLLDGPIGSTSSTRGQQINENNKLKMELKERERIEKELAARKEKEEGGGGKGESRFLNHWRDAIAKTTSPSVLSMAIYILDSSIAWDKSVMKASCQLCKGGDNEDKLLLCDACDRGYHTYCFKPPLENIPDGDWFCWECINKATGNKCCIVCGKGQIPNVKLLCCDKCVKAYHQDCIVPPVGKAPRGRWFCPDHREGTEGKGKVTLSMAISVSMNTSGGSGGNGGGGPVVTGASGSGAGTGGGGLSGGEEKSASIGSAKKASPKKKARGSAAAAAQDGNVSDSSNSSSFVGQGVGSTTPIANHASSQESDGDGSKSVRASTPVSSCSNKKESGSSSKKKKKSLSKKKEKKEVVAAAVAAVEEVVGSDEGVERNNNSDCGGSSSPEKEKGAAVAVKVNSKKFKSEMGWCEKILDDLVGHEDAWPFLEPVNTRQFPTYKKIIKTPMDLQTIRTRLVATHYKNKESFLQDVRLIFDNCETFNEDDSPVGKAGHTLRLFFEGKPGVGVGGNSSGGGGGGSNNGGK